MRRDDTNLSRFFPFLIWGKEVNASTLKSDLMAGLTGAVIVLPQGVAFAMIAGMPPVYGLYTAIITPVIAALFGSSYHLISGPTTAASIVVFGALHGIAEPGTPVFISLALSLALMAGIMKFLLGVARMGSLVNFVSTNVLTGFAAGAAILIAGGQLKHLFGVSWPSGGNFLTTFENLVSHAHEFNYWSFAAGLIALIVSVLCKKFIPKLPGMLIGMIASGFFVYILGADAHGLKLLGEMPAGFPPFTVPEINLDIIRELAPSAFALAILGLIEAVAIARSIALKSRQQLDVNQEFIGQGLSNIVGAFFSSYVSSGSFTRSGVNYEAGAKTPMAAIFAAVFLLLILLLIAPLTAYLPMPAMAGVILLVAYNLIDFQRINKIFKLNRREAIVFSVTFLTTLFLKLEFAIFAGVFFSLIFYLQRTSQPRIVTLAPEPDHPRRQMVNVERKLLLQCPQLHIIRIDGSLFFGAVEYVAAQIAEMMEQDERKHILIVATGINFIDVAGAEMLVNEAERLRKVGGALYLSSLKFQARQMMSNQEFSEAFGSENIFSHKELAISEIYKRLDSEICAKCDVRIFRECNKKEKLTETNT